MKTVNVGIIGCGNISGIYFKTLPKFDIINVVGCADVDISKAESQADVYNIAKSCSVDELLSDLEVDIILNLTPPQIHTEISLKALNAGKHVYTEKPLATTIADGETIVKKAEEKGLLVGNAPDTFLGGGIQTCRKLIDDGWIGRPVAATAFMMNRGPEGWHPNPEFFYQAGAGPMFDMGPYYLTALINLIGPVRRVTGSTQISFPERTITSQEKYGSKIKVNTPTHVAGLLDFQNGAVGTIITSFDVMATQTPKIEVHGTEGSLIVPDPNTFGGPVYLRNGQSNHEWREIPLTHSYSENSRGLGVADMAYALASGRKHRANGAQALHVLEIMHGFHEASTQDQHYFVQNICDRPIPLPLGLRQGTLDD
ncbi:Gfo/Idh/MocA family protein [Tuberibacillus sp. Marseille-P3662]|uniref:Gfo/Idh/MocA family protein n=1 Tax=Tuberibacillus sp. Marseille-P3662 TaxID=1965358 RepID=UPI000A1CDDF1|nr:Gfo/Idh/MocA family oxidoreductase [Tuberibacillus sp. Marseille-P3662]